MVLILKQITITSEVIPFELSSDVHETQLHHMSIYKNIDKLVLLPIPNTQWLTAAH